MMINLHAGTLENDDCSRQAGLSVTGDIAEAEAAVPEARSWLRGLGGQDTPGHGFEESS